MSSPSLPSRPSSLRNVAASRGTGETVPVVARAERGATATRPPASIVPVRNPIEERWPSPIARKLMTKRRLPGGTPDWSGAATMLGLHTAAPSMAYSLVKVAPSSSCRVSVSVRAGSSRSAISDA